MAHKKYTSITVGRKMGKLEWQARFVVGKLRRGSALTRQDQLNCLGKIGKAMQRYGLNNIRDIKPSHVERYFAELRDKGISEGRMANHATAMRMLCRIIGKSDIVPSNRDLGCNRNVANRTKHANIGIDGSKVVEVRKQLSPNNCIAYDMALSFGLRQKETLLSHKVVSRDGRDYLVVEGAKGGRPRQIPITTYDQRTTLARNHAYRNEHGGKLIDAEMNLKQGIKHLQNELANAGATRESRANMHTLRREWIIENCKDILQAPAKERASMIADLAEQVGHGREEVLRAYTSLLDGIIGK